MTQEGTAADGMHTIMERKGEDVVVEGGFTFKLRSDMTALSVIATNRVFHGDVFERDGYVYRDGVRHRKWFVNRDGWSHFWFPHLDNLPRVEALYHRLQQRLDVLHARRLSLLAAIDQRGVRIKKYGEMVAIAHAEPTHNVGGDQWWMYRVRFNKELKTWSFSYDWVPKPDVPENHDLGQALYKLDYGRHNWSGSMSSVLNEAIVKYIRKVEQAPLIATSNRSTTSRSTNVTTGIAGTSTAMGSGRLNGWPGLAMTRGGSS